MRYPVGIVILHTGRKSDPQPLALPAGSFGWQPAAPLPPNLKPELPGMGPRPTSIMGSRETIERAIGKQPRGLGFDQQDARDWRARAEDYLARLQAEWDAAWEETRPTLVAEWEDAHFCQAAVWQGPRSLQWCEGPRVVAGVPLPGMSGTDTGHHVQVHESAGEIRQLVELALRSGGVWDLAAFMATAEKRAADEREMAATLRRVGATLARLRSSSSGAHATGEVAVPMEQPVEGEVTNWPIVTAAAERMGPMGDTAVVHADPAPSGLWDWEDTADEMTRRGSDDDEGERVSDENTEDEGEE